MDAARWSNPAGRLSDFLMPNNRENILFQGPHDMNMPKKDEHNIIENLNTDTRR